MNVEILNQLVDLVEFLLGESDGSRCHVLENTTLLTSGGYQIHGDDSYLP